jgi:hypothetical protein
LIIICGIVVFLVCLHACLLVPVPVFIYLFIFGGQQKKRFLKKKGSQGQPYTAYFEGPKKKESKREK